MQNPDVNCLPKFYDRAIIGEAHPSENAGFKQTILVYDRDICLEIYTGLMKPEWLKEDPDLDDDDISIYADESIGRQLFDAAADAFKEGTRPIFISRAI